MEILIEQITDTCVGVATYVDNKKIGCAFYYESEEDYCEKFGQACTAIMRRIKKIPHPLPAVEEVVKAVEQYMKEPPEGVIITGCNHEIKPIGSEKI